MVTSRSSGTAALGLLPTGCPYVTPVLLTLSAQDRLRRAAGAGRRTVLVAGHSVTQELVPSLLVPRGRGAIASAPGGDIFLATAFARLMIDYAPADVVLLPLVWPGFSSAAAGSVPDPASTAWIVSRHEEWHLTGLGYGHTTGLTEQLRRLVQEIPRLYALHPGWERDDAERRAYAAEMCDLAYRVPVPGPRALQRMEALRVYGAERGVTVLYFLTPHNPTYFDGIVDRVAFDHFRNALAPYVFADYADLLPTERFYGDFVHFDLDGSTILSTILGNDIQRSPVPSVRGSPTPPTFTWRCRRAVADLRAEARENLHPGDFFSLVAADARRSGGTLWTHLKQLYAEVKMQASQYPRYIREVFGRDPREDEE